MSLTADVDVPETPPRGVPRWAWGLCWLMFASTALNYMDRQAVSVVGDLIRAEFRIDFEQLGWAIAAFQISYALFQVPAGFLADRWDVRWTYAGAVLWWSLAAVAVSFAPTLGVLMIFRAILGVGESFNWPCALRVTSTVLPPEARGMGNGIFNSGAAVGAVITPLILAPMTLRYGWRTAFAAVGASGLVWVIVWLAAVRGGRGALLARAKRNPPGDDDLPTPRPGLSSAAAVAFGGLFVLSVVGGAWGFSDIEITREVLPLLGRSHEAFVREWKVDIGSVIKKGDPLAELDAEGEIYVVRAGSGGTVFRIEVDRGGMLTTGTPVVTVMNKTLGLSAVWLAVAFFMTGLLFLARVMPRRSLAGAGWAESLAEVVRLRRFWVLAAVSVSINVCWHFLVNWLPTYLKTDRGMSFVAGSMLSALPFLAADVGNLGGGWLSMRLARRGLSPSRARFLVLIGCVFLISGGATVGWVRSDRLILVILALMALGTAAFMANYFAYCQEVSSRHTGLVVGYLGGLGNLFAAGFSPVAGRIKDTAGSFGPVFVIVGLLPFVGVAALAVGWGDPDEPKPV